MSDKSKIPPCDQFYMLQNYTNSSFYTSNSKDSVFNFSSAPTFVNLPNLKSCTPGSKTVHSAEKRKPDGNFGGQFVPRKLYVTEAAMSDHFSKMNLTPAHNLLATCGLQTHVPVTSHTSFSLSVDPLQKHSPDISSSHCNGSFDTLLEDENEESCQSDTNSSIIRFSDDLSSHLRSHRINPTNEFLRGLLMPEPCLAIVPFDPNRQKNFLLPPTKTLDISSDIFTQQNFTSSIPTTTSDDHSMDLETCGSLPTVGMNTNCAVPPIVSGDLTFRNI